MRGLDIHKNIVVSVAKLTLGLRVGLCDSTQQDRATETGNEQLRHVAHRAKQYIILIRGHGQVTKVPGQAPHITTEYCADIRYRTPRAGVCLHIQKPKPQASIKTKIEKFHKLFDVYKTIH